MPYFPIDNISTNAITDTFAGCITLDTATGFTDSNTLQLYTATDGCRTYPLPCTLPPKAINDIRSIGIPSNAPMFSTSFTWDYNESCTTGPVTYDPWITTSTGTSGGTTFDIPVNQNYGIAGSTTLTLDSATANTATVGNPFYLRKPLRLP